ncbi:MAG: hypothetical protein J07HQW2_01896 [Haloquadratum walsbyi J07HQW2]|uniref:Uncharacterized protein n=1 Tax=Haloquadratum walsbyi J07HQW2 TaxID=1238425 RepID=U1MY81_9EURY|nr:MAG: hypothetical protein J07HQW2_01896 [Haloquadratum walsbyi J07HQW2]
MKIKNDFQTGKISVRYLETFIPGHFGKPSNDSTTTCLISAKKQKGYKIGELK